MKVMIGTPAYDSKVELDYMKSLLGTMNLFQQYGFHLEIQTLSGNSLIQSARNEIFKLALEGEYDALVFVDSDQGWNPDDFLTLLSHDVDIIGGVVPSKNDLIGFNAKALPEGFTVNKDGLIEVRGVGTGFLKISLNAMKQIWEQSIPYDYDGKEGRSVFEPRVINGKFVGEDIAFCMKWREMGGKVYIDPNIVCSHIGKKTYKGNFIDFLRIIGVNYDYT